MFHTSIINLLEPGYYSLTSHSQKTSRFSSLFDQKRNKMYTQTKWDSMLSVLTTYMEMDSLLSVMKQTQKDNMQRYNLYNNDYTEVESRGVVT